MSSSFDNTELRGIPQEAVKPPIDQLKKSRSNIGHNSLKRPADGSQTSIPLHSKKSKH